MRKLFKAKNILLLFLFVLGFSLMGCGMPNHDNLYDDHQALIEKEDLSSKESAVRNQNNEFYNCSIEKSSGIETIWTYKPLQDKVLKAEYNLSVAAGSAKLVLINGA